ncbi:MAG: GNAT family N-acetyltransferase [bacterium]|nr:GNAT family N-acetyltransferase [bacterium]
MQGPRVSLRWLTERDVDALYELFGNADVARYWSCAAYADRAQAESLLRQVHDCYARHTLYQWGVTLDGDDRVIGTCTLASLDASNGRAEVGFALNRSHWGGGLMSEALRLLLDYAFGTLGLRRIEADIDPRNAASIRLVERLGFVREGLLRERWLVDGKIQDSVLYGLLDREWNRERAGS